MSIELKTGFWPRCREVSITDEKIVCVLTPERSYDLVWAYQYDPHVRLINCATDEQLLSFVHAWGPLSVSYDEWNRGSCSLPLSRYWIFQLWLKGFVNLVSAFKDSANEREALHEFIKADIDDWRSSAIAPPHSEPLPILGMKSQFGIGGEISTWLRDSPLRTLRSAIQFLIEVMPVEVHPRLMCIRRSGKPAVEARWSVDSLQVALKWMVWYDEFTQHPLICCQACRKVFRPETAHPRKYCSYECAHRIAAREWQRKQSNSRRNPNGARKAR
jgi:hypothetical protein